jgi:hypothetical protein
MAERDEQGTLPIVELLGVEPAMLANDERTAAAPVVFISLRPQPQHSWQSFSFPLSWKHAERLRDDLTNLLKEFGAPAQAS